MVEVDRAISRRSFVRVAAMGLAALPVLAACGGAAASPASSQAPASAAGSASARSVKPSYIPATGGPKPDLPGRQDGVDAGYFKFPSPLFKSVKQPVGSGDDITAMTNVIQGAVVPMEQNPAWQAVNKDMGITFRQRLYGGNDYPTGLNTSIAGGDLPDLIYNRYNIPKLPDFLQAQCADLTTYLGGDAVKDYPNLANFPPPVWAETVYNNAIYAVPVPRAPFLNALLVRQDLADAAKLEAPKTADGFKKFLQALTNPGAKHWGLGSALSFGLTSQSPLHMIFGVPNNWKIDGGKLIKDYETDEFKAAVGYGRDLFAAGIYHPNTQTFNGTTLSNALRAGEIAVASHSFGALIAQWPLLAAQNPAGRLRVIHPFSADGKAKPVYHTGPGNFGITHVKKGSPDRVKLALRALNYIGSPFGSSEWALLNYGVQGTDYTLDSQGVPKPTDKGKAEVVSTWKYITNNPEVLYDPNRSQEYATNIQADEKAMADAAIPDPTLGFYSPSYSESSVTLDRAMNDGIADIVQGRRPISDLDGLVADWRSKGGNQARGEFEAAIVKAGKSAG